MPGSDEEPRERTRELTKRELYEALVKHYKYKSKANVSRAFIAHLEQRVEEERRAEQDGKG